MNDVLAAAIIGHLVGDYLLQPHWMAIGKKQSSWVCSLHALLWTAAVVGLSQGFSPYGALALFTTHFIQDRGSLVVQWMDLIGQRPFREPPFGPWSIIVVDNVWHLLTIYIIWKVGL